MGQGYHLHLVKFGKQSETIFPGTTTGGWRVFKSIDAAANTANGIGFRRIEIDLSGRWEGQDKNQPPRSVDNAPAHRPNPRPAGRPPVRALAHLAKILFLGTSHIRNERPSGAVI